MIVLHRLLHGTPGSSKRRVTVNRRFRRVCPDGAGSRQPDPDARGTVRDRGKRPVAIRDGIDWTAKCRGGTRSRNLPPTPSRLGTGGKSPRLALSQSSQSRAQSSARQFTRDGVRRIDATRRGRIAVRNARTNGSRRDGENAPRRNERGGSETDPPEI